MPDETDAQTDEGSPQHIHPLSDDPDLFEEWSALEDPEDRADYLEAVRALAELDEDELVPWEDAKTELGY